MKPYSFQRISLTVRMALVCAFLLSHVHVGNASVRTATHASAVVGCEMPTGGAPGQISGRVTDAVTGQPLAGIQVSAQRTNSSQFTVSLTDTDGRYRLSNLGTTAPWRVTFGASGEYLSQQYENGRLIYIFNGLVMPGIDAKMQRRGWVTMTPMAYPSQPLPNGRLYAWSFLKDDGTLAATLGRDSLSGTWLAALPPGRYRVRLVPNVLFDEFNPTTHAPTYYTGEYGFPESDPGKARVITVTAGTTTTLANAYVPSGVRQFVTVTLNGYQPSAVEMEVRSADGKPLLAEYYAYRSNTHVVFEMVRPYTTTVVLQPVEGAPGSTTAFALAAPVTRSVPADAPVTIALPPAVSITGTVRDVAGTGWPPPAQSFVGIVAYVNGRIIRSGFAQSGGSYTISGLPAMPMTVSVSGYYARSIANSGQISETLSQSLFRNIYYNTTPNASLAQVLTPSAGSVFGNVNFVLQRCSDLPADNNFPRALLPMIIRN